MHNFRDHSFGFRMFVGIGVIAVGVLFLLNNMHIVDAGYYIHLWPALLIIFGVAHLFQHRTSGGTVWSVILIFVGTAMVCDRLDFIYFSIWDFWPLILVFAGIMLITQGSFRRWQRSSVPTSGDPNNLITATAIMGGSRRYVTSKNFQGGNLFAIMGGIEIDLHDADIQTEATLDVFAMMGGIVLRVPEDWLIVVNTLPIMGGVDDKTHPPTDATKRLHITGFLMMGGMEIKNTELEEHRHHRHY
jgi:predicted membrane protein